MGRIAQGFAWVVGISTVGVGAAALWYERRAQKIAKEKSVDGLPPAIDAPRETVTLEMDGASPIPFSFYVDRSGGGRPLVLVHGIFAAASAIEVKPLFQRFRKHRTVLAVDLPGFGKSGRHKVPYSSALYARALIALLEREARRGADVVALHLSSEFAARVARDRPDLVKSLVLISPTGLGGAEAMPEPDPLERWVQFPVVGQRIFDLLVTKVSLQHQLSKAFNGSVDAELVDYSYRSARCLGARFPAMALYRGELSTPDARRELYEKLRVPTLVIHDNGTHSDFSRLTKLIAKNPHVRAEKVTRARAYPHYEKPEQTFLLLERAWAQKGAAQEAVWR